MGSKRVEPNIVKELDAAKVMIEGDACGIPYCIIQGTTEKVNRETFLSYD